MEEKEYNEIMDEIKKPTIDVKTDGDSVTVGVDVDNDGKDDFTLTLKGKIAIGVTFVIGLIAILKVSGLI